VGLFVIALFWVGSLPVEPSRKASAFRERSPAGWVRAAGLPTGWDGEVGLLCGGKAVEGREGRVWRSCGGVGVCWVGLCWACIVRRLRRIHHRPSTLEPRGWVNWRKCGFHDGFPPPR